MKTELQKIPGVGPNLEKHLIALGYTTIASLKHQDPEVMYARDCLLSGQHLDKCLLYVYRCAVYFAGNDIHDSEKLQWWYWKDKS
jgi:hypothetical protein